MDFEAPKFTKLEFSQIRVFVFFAIFILIFQLLQYCTTKNVAKKYRELFSNVTETITLTNSLSNESSSIQRFILNLSLTKDINEFNKYKFRILNSEKKLDTDLFQLEKLIDNYDSENLDEKNLLINLKLNWKNYKQNYFQYIEKLKDNKNESDEFRKKTLRPIYEQFQRNANLFFTKIFIGQKNLTEKISSNAERNSFILLISGNILLVLIILISIFILFTERKNLV